MFNDDDVQATPRQVANLSTDRLPPMSKHKRKSKTPLRVLVFRVPVEAITNKKTLKPQNYCANEAHPLSICPGKRTELRTYLVARALYPLEPGQGYVFRTVDGDPLPD